MIGAWRTILEHRFPDSHLENARAVPGHWEADNPPEIQPGAATGSGGPLYHASFVGGRSAQYAFDDVVTDIIGLDVAVGIEFSIPVDPAYLPSFYVNRHATFIGAPDCFRLGLHHYRIEADLLGAPTRWDTGFFPPKRGTVVWRWLNTGQSGLYVNNTLVAFRNDVSPGQTLQLDRVYVGGFLPTAVSPHGWMHYLRLNVTRTNDASVAVGYHLDLDKDDLAELHECFSASQMRSLQATVMNFMRQFIQTATQDWQLSPGGKGTSSAPAVMAHELAMELTALLVPRLKRDQGTDELIVEKWDRFLSLLRDAQPQDFCNELKALQKILGAEDPECKRKRAQLVKKYGAHYEKLDGLFARLGGLLVEKCEGESH